MDFDNISVEQFNEEFLELIDDPKLEKEASVVGSRYVRMKLREEGVMRRYFEDIERVTTEDNRYQIDPDNSDSGYMLLDREPDSYALRLTSRGEPTGEYIQGDKWIVPFQKYASPEWEKNEQELRNIRIPITDIIRQNVVLDMQEEEDLDFKNKLNAAIEISENEYVTTNDAFYKDDLTKLFNMIDHNRLKSHTIIMARPTLNDIYGWDYSEVGGLVTDAVENGVDDSRIGGKRLITTSNTDVIKPGEIYVLTAPEFLGESFDLHDPKFWMKKDKDMISMSSWYYNGFNIGNYKSVGRMVLADSEAEPVL